MVFDMGNTLEADAFLGAMEAISTEGYAIIEDFLPATDIESLVKLTHEKNLNGQLDSAKTGKTRLKNQQIRGDYIAWLNAEDNQPALIAYFQQMEKLRLMLNAQLFMNVQELETHIALYPAGACYQKHLDQFSHGEKPEIQHRQLSAVLYLNSNWQAEYGGALRLYLNEHTSIDVLPNAGRMVLFLSAKFWHEVLPANRERLSLTAWFRTRDHAFI